MLSLHKGRKTADGKQETENPDGKPEARSAEEHVDVAQRTENRRRKTQTEDFHGQVKIVTGKSRFSQIYRNNADPPGGWLVSINDAFKGDSRTRGKFKGDFCITDL